MLVNNTPRFVEKDGFDMVLVVVVVFHVTQIVCHHDEERMKGEGD